MRDEADLVPNLFDAHVGIPFGTVSVSVKEALGEQTYIETVWCAYKSCDVTDGSVGGPSKNANCFLGGNDEVYAYASARAALRAFSVPCLA